jgi:hypothetical protein
VVSADVSLLFPLGDLPEVGSELVRMERHANQLEQRVAKMGSLMSAAEYAKVPDETKQKNAEQLSQDSAELATVSASIASFKSALTLAQHAHYQRELLASLELQESRLEANIAKMCAALPADVQAQPKKSLAKIAEAKEEWKDISNKANELRKSMER